MKVQIQVTKGNINLLSSKLQQLLAEAFNKHVRVSIKK